MGIAPSLDRRRRLLIAGGAAAFALGTAPGLALGAGKEKEVTATEDLMREHGVLRRALLVYIETVPRLRSSPGSIDPRAINRTAKLFRSFGEDYHERKLEEAHIFPRVKKAGGPAAGLVDTLVAQHDRGREITDYIAAVAAKGAIGTADAEPLARAFESFVLMYQNHTAREDTVVFTAWKGALSEHQLHEMGELFEKIEHQAFGRDGFDAAVDEIAAMEGVLGFSDIVQFTAPPPPHA